MQNLEGKRILIVEDEPLIGITLTDILESVGCVVLGPAYDVRQAMNYLDVDRIDCAVLDVNLGAGQTSAPIADALEARKIPFMFATGYGEDALRSKDRERYRVDKPYDDDQVYLALQKCLASYVR